MAINDLLSDMLTRIRNGQQASLGYVDAPYSKLLLNVLEVLKREGYIADFEESEISKGRKQISIGLKYYDGQPAIREIKRVSRPGLRVYRGIEKLGRVRNGLGVSILSTSKGVMSDYEAKQANIGGEVLCSIF
jgi:small subunit ribosomal protein S8